MWFSPPPASSVFLPITHHVCFVLIPIKPGFIIIRNSDGLSYTVSRVWEPGASAGAVCLPAHHVLHLLPIGRANLPPESFPSTTATHFHGFFCGHGLSFAPWGLRRLQDITTGCEEIDTTEQIYRHPLCAPSLPSTQNTHRLPSFEWGWGQRVVLVAKEAIFCQWGSNSVEQVSC